MNVYACIYNLSVPECVRMTFKALITNAADDILNFVVFFRENKF